MTTLRVIIDDLSAGPTGGLARYAEELTRQLIATAPRGSQVAGIVSASPEPDYAHVAERLPGLADLYKSPLARRELAAAWAHGFTRLPGAGMVHATSLLAPLRRHERAGDRRDQTVVTVHDAIAWTDPELLPGRQASWNRTMTKRAERFADAVVVPTHVVADVLAENFAFGDRLRVIGGAPSSRLHPIPDAIARRDRLGVRDDYVLTVAGLDPRKGLEVILDALSRVSDSSLVVVGAAPGDAEGIAERARDRGLDAERIVVLDHLEDDDLSAVLQGASAFLQASRAEGFGLALVEALSFGLPTIHSDDAALVEVAADAGVVVARDDPEEADGYAAAIREVLDDDELRGRLSLAARDRARAFSWRDSAEKVWQLHADL